MGAGGATAAPTAAGRSAERQSIHDSQRGMYNCSLLSVCTVYCLLDHEVLSTVGAMSTAVVCCGCTQQPITPWACALCNSAPKGYRAFLLVSIVAHCRVHASSAYALCSYALSNQIAELPSYNDWVSLIALAMFALFSLFWMSVPQMKLLT